mgnify:CR=1 FL=1|tara:strand:+ start:246 stop:416 length:171 start_codon:yes stop_codon:yes gene_type:complete
MRKINPVARSLALARRRSSSLVVPDKTKYNRKKSKEVANATFYKDNNLENERKDNG